MEKVPIRSDGSKQHIHTGKYILTLLTLVSPSDEVQHIKNFNYEVLTDVDDRHQNVEQLILI